MQAREAERVVRRWVCAGEWRGVLAARQALPPRPLLQAQLLEEWLNHYRRLAYVANSLRPTSHTITAPGAAAAPAAAGAAAGGRQALPPRPLLQAQLLEEWLNHYRRLAYVANSLRPTSHTITAPGAAAAPAAAGAAAGGRQALPPRPLLQAQLLEEWLNHYRRLAYVANSLRPTSHTITAPGAAAAPAAAGAAAGGVAQPLPPSRRQALPPRPLLQAQLLEEWLNHYRRLAYRQALPPRPLLQAQLLEEWLNHYRRLAYVANSLRPTSHTITAPGAAAAPAAAGAAAGGRQALPPRPLLQAQLLEEWLNHYRRLAYVANSLRPTSHTITAPGAAAAPAAAGAAAGGRQALPPRPLLQAQLLEEWLNHYRRLAYVANSLRPTSHTITAPGAAAAPAAAGAAAGGVAQPLPPSRRQALPPRPLLQAQLLEEWLNHYRRLAYVANSLRPTSHTITAPGAAAAPAAAAAQLLEEWLNHYRRLAYVANSLRPTSHTITAPGAAAAPAAAGAAAGGRQALPPRPLLQAQLLEEWLNHYRRLAYVANSLRPTSHTITAPGAAAAPAAAGAAAGGRQALPPRPLLQAQLLEEWLNHYRRLAYVANSLRPTSHTITAPGAAAAPAAAGAAAGGRQALPPRPLLQAQLLEEWLNHYRRLAYVANSLRPTSHTITAPGAAAAPAAAGAAAGGRQALPPRPLLQAQLLEEWLNHYRRLAYVANSLRPTSHTITAPGAAAAPAAAGAAAGGVAQPLPPSRVRS
ncbi:hypothetical protein HF086_011813 [Spodoptera exigua]|uniref:Uncharacterized protein n=1 Tax=Spodoptera exigua TaxID=7107 RepID=A0A922SPH7_SPOEX|nr:hypothetical protein HF086_011813 [Spodoptera exigua]